jgi:hypothetical protein
MMGRGGRTGRDHTHTQRRTTTSDLGVVIAEAICRKCFWYDFSQHEIYNWTRHYFPDATIDEVVRGYAIAAEVFAADYFVPAR